MNFEVILVNERVVTLVISTSNLDEFLNAAYILLKGKGKNRNNAVLKTRETHR